MRCCRVELGDGMDGDTVGWSGFWVRPGYN